MRFKSQTSSALEFDIAFNHREMRRRSSLLVWGPLLSRAHVIANGGAQSGEHTLRSINRALTRSFAKSSVTNDLWYVNSSSNAYTIATCTRCQAPCTCSFRHLSQKLSTALDLHSFVVSSSTCAALQCGSGSGDHRPRSAPKTAFLVMPRMVETASAVEASAAASSVSR